MNPSDELAGIITIRVRVLGRDPEETRVSVSKADVARIDAEMAQGWAATLVSERPATKLADWCAMAMRRRLRAPATAPPVDPMPEPGDRVRLVDGSESIVRRVLASGPLGWIIDCPDAPAMIEVRLIVGANELRYWEDVQRYA